MNLTQRFTRHAIILGSASPRRKQLLGELGINFSIRTADVDETAPAHLNGFETAIFVAKLKASALLPQLTENEILITADTEVWQDKRRFGKPKNKEEASEMLTALSGSKHQVISGVAISTTTKQHTFWVKTDVEFYKLAVEDIAFYIENGHPFDKAGGYGIQEWIGLIGIKKFSGSYTNVVGLPTAELYHALTQFID